MRFGNFELHSIETGEFRLDGGAMFGVVPKVIWQKTNPPDEKNRIQMALRCLLIRGKDKTILVDSGVGEHWGEKQREIYAIDHSRYRLETSLQKLGLKLDDITDVVLTHLHFDHVGGITERRGDKFEIRFKNAKIWVHEENLNHAHAPSEKDRASFIESTLQPLFQSNQLVKTSGETEITPGVKTWVTHGHTPGQQLVHVTSAGENLLVCGDTIPTSSHIPIPYVMAYDLFPMKTIEEKKKILARALSEKWILFFVHDPKVIASKVGDVDGKFICGEAFVF